MALTRDYKETVVARIKRGRKFAWALYAGAMTALLGGETAEGLSMLRDLVHAEITFKELARRLVTACPTSAQWLALFRSCSRQIWTHGLDTQQGSYKFRSEALRAHSLALTI